MVQADVELAFVEFPDRHIVEIDSQVRVARVAHGIKIHHFLTGRIEHVHRNLVTGYAGCLRAVRIRRNRGACAVTLERGWYSRVRIAKIAETEGVARSSSWYSRVRIAKIAETEGVAR